MGHDLIALGSAFVGAGLAAKLGRRLRLPTIPFFMAAGLLLGPNSPGATMVGDADVLELLAALGLILLLFHLGLEFDLEDFIANAPRLLAAGGGYIAINVGAGLLLGFALGWGTVEALIIAGVTGISSSAIVTKLLVELRRLTNRETPMILGVIVVEDVFLALYLAVLAPFLGEAASMGRTLATLATAFAFLGLLFALARYGGAHVGRLIGHREDEILTILFLGLAVLVAGFAEELGVSDAIGAFMVGLVIAGTVYRERVETLVQPLRDAFASIFFFAFGLILDPAAFPSVAAPALIAVLLALATNLAAGLLAARLNGLDARRGVNAGLTLLARGEFALILAALAAAAGLDPRIGPFAGLYVLVLAVVGPLAAAQAPRIGDVLDRAVARHGPSAH